MYSTVYRDTVRQVLADFPVCDCWHYCKALSEEKFSKIERTELYVTLELCNIVISHTQRNPPKLV